MRVTGVGVMGVMGVGVSVGFPKALEEITGPVAFNEFMEVFTGLAWGAVLAGEAPRLSKLTKSDFQRLAGPCDEGASEKSPNWESGNVGVKVDAGVVLTGCIGVKFIGVKLIGVNSCWGLTGAVTFTGCL